MNKFLGFTHKIDINSLSQTEIARVVAAHKERYIVRNFSGSYQAEITGNLRFSTASSNDFPVVGDWVHIMPMDEKQVIITQVFNRYSLMERQAVGKTGESQILASNIDFAFVVMAIDRDFNLNRLDRYLSMCHSGKVTPILLLSKTDLQEQLVIESLISKIKKRHSNLEIETVSNKNEDSLIQMKKRIKPAHTYCFVGSSGVGKSTIVNYLLGDEILQTSTISESTQKGRHTTTHRELFVLPDGGIVIDTPGMREVGITDISGEIANTFDNIAGLAAHCRFDNCTHTNETDCAVLEARETGALSEEEYESYQKLKREQEHFADSVQQKRQKGKELSKIIRRYQKQKRGFKY